MNNAVYASYLQHCRHEFLAARGVDADLNARSGAALALSSLNMEFRRPLRSRDRFRASLALAKMTGARVSGGRCIPVHLPGACTAADRLTLNDKIVFEQTLWKVAADGEAEDELVLRAEATCVSLDADYRPKRIPAEMRLQLQAQ